MKPSELRDVKTGDILRHASGATYVVTDVTETQSGRVPIATQTVSVTVPDEWLLVARATGHEWGPAFGGGPANIMDEL